MFQCGTSSTTQSGSIIAKHRQVFSFIFPLIVAFPDTRAPQEISTFSDMKASPDTRPQFIFAFQVTREFQNTLPLQYTFASIHTFPFSYICDLP